MSLHIAGIGLWKIYGWRLCFISSCSIQKPILSKISGISMNIFHPSLLRTFGFSATSTYNSYLPLLFGIFGMIWGHFWNVRKGRFRGHGGRRGQTASKSKTTKILNQNLQKLDEIQNLASATSKMTSWPQWPRNGLNEFFQKIHFSNQCIKLSKMSYSLTF